MALSRSGLIGMGLATLYASATVASGDVLFVDASAPRGGDGHSWAAAMSQLRDALAAAHADPGVTEIWVAEGTYRPSETDATASFVLRNGLALYGGFAGGERSLAERDWQDHPTRLDGDIGGDDVVGSGQYWYVDWLVNSANCGHVIDASGTDSTAVVDGFIVANGNTGPVGTPAGSPLMFGGGLYAVAGSPTVRHCTFTHCLAAFAAGGAVYLHDSAATFDDCRFLENYGHLADGGGLYVGGASSPTITDCVFQYNIVVAGQPDAQGGGLASWSTSPIALERCQFDGNVAKSFYSVGNSPAYGGGLFSFTKPITLVDCSFTKNTGIIGGGFCAFGQATLVNCLFSENKAIPLPNDPYPEIGGDGAAMVFYSQAPAVSKIINCSVASNHGKKYAVNQWLTGSYEVLNSIVWGNTATDPEVTGGYKVHLGGSFDAEYSCIQTIFDPPAPGEDPIEPENLPGCMDTNPAFVGSADLRLQAGSPCIDAGKNALVPVGISADLDGAGRFADDPDAPDVGAGAPPLVDLGCYERHVLPPCAPADVDCDGAVGATDLALVLGAWGTADPAADVNDDGTVDAADLAIVLGSWG